MEKRIKTRVLKLWFIKIFWGLIKDDNDNCFIFC